MSIVPNWAAFTPQLGEVNLLDVDIGGPGPFALVSGPGVINNIGKFGRNSFYSEVIEGWDPILGGAEFVFVQASASVAPSQIVQFAMGQDSNNNCVLQVTPWTGTAYAGQELGVAISPIGIGQWGWVQINGFALTAHGPTTAGQTVNSATISGQIATITTNSAHGLVVGQIVNMTGFTPTQFNGSYVVASVPTTTTFTVTLPITALPANNATVQGSYTYYAGPVTGATVSSGSNSTLACTLVTSTNHGLQVGDVVTVTGATPAAYNVTNAIITAVPAATQFTYNALTNPGGVTTVQPTYTVTSPAINGQAYYSGTGAVSGVAVNGKHMLGAQWAVGTSGVSGQLGSVSQGKTLPAWQAVLWMGRPVSQGQIT
jgi:hypothetical protein